MDSHHLRYFVSLAETKSLSKSAALLAMSQPSLSRRLSKLEAQLGTPLFYRNGRGLVLTEAGDRLLNYARTALDNLRLLENEIKSLKSAPGGEVVVGIPPMIGERLVVPMVMDFRKQFPKVQLHIIEGLSGHIHEWLLTGKLDVAILYNAPRNSVIVTEPLLTDELCLVGASTPSGAGQRTITFSELCGHPLIMPSRPHGLRSIIEHAAESRGLRLNNALTVDSFRAMIDLAEAGGGYTIVPFVAVQERVKKGTLRAWTITDPTINGVLSVVTSTQRPPTAASRHLLKSLKEHVELLRKQGRWASMPPEYSSGDRQPAAVNS